MFSYYNQETRTAQVASVDQQRELTRYLTELNRWLQRDVDDRRNEITAVLQHVIALGQAVQGLQARGDRGIIIWFRRGIHC